MKIALTLSAFFLSLSAHAAPAKTFGIICNLADTQKSGNPNIATEKLSLVYDQTTELAQYGGRKYEVTIWDLSQIDGRIRNELVISSRDLASGAVIGSAITTFTTETPDLIYQEGPNILVRCAD